MNFLKSVVVLFILIYLIPTFADAFRVSDIVERAGVPFGSVYQYFPDRTAIIGTLAEHYNATVNDGAGKVFERMRSPTGAAGSSA